MYTKRFIRACLPALFIMASQLANAASGDGSLVGHLNTKDKGAVSGAEVTARDPATGFSRKVKADADGFYRFPFLPVGTLHAGSVQGRQEPRIAPERAGHTGRRDHGGPGIE